MKGSTNKRATKLELYKHKDKRVAELKKELHSLRSYLANVDNMEELRVAESRLKTLSKEIEEIGADLQ